MDFSILPLLVAPAALLIATAALVPRSAADASPVPVRRWVTSLAGLQLGVALIATLAVIWATLLNDSSAAAWTFAPDSPGLTLSPVYLDGVSCLMFLMVSFVGWVICRYSIRYLDGDRTQGNYFRWTGFTLGSVSWMVVSGDLLLFFALWLMTSLGLHRLLLHVPGRPAAVRAAWTKFTVSRIGDASLAIALIMLYAELGTLNIARLLAAAATLQPDVNVQVASCLLILAAAIKSAQFPFHTWLPQTLETPTPVSALMHAGIVNAGGYLMVRTSPLVSLTPWALAGLAVIGAVTACYAAIVMVTQTSVKKSLAYSTIAQMGFMMLQCGLGAFSAALFHILAHSMYKAHAFLDSGSVIAAKPSPRMTNQSNAASSHVGLAPMVAALLVSIGCLVVSFRIVEADLTAKPGGLILGSILCIALARWLGSLIATASGTLAFRGVLMVGGLCLSYASLLTAVNALSAGALTTAALPAVAWSAAGLIIVAGFAVMLLLDQRLASGKTLSGKGRLYVHANNGFYVESVLRSVFGPLTRT